MEKKGNRAYHSQIRQQQAHDTKERIAEAADKLVKANGYENTTIGSIAQEAGVASQTIYATFGSKSGIILYLIRKAINQSTLGEISESIIQVADDQAFYQLMGQEVKNKLIMEDEAICSVGGFSMLYPELMELVKVAGSHRRQYIKDSIERIKKIRKIFPENSNEELRMDLLWALMDGHILHGLVHMMGWNLNEFQNVITQLIRFICNDVTFLEDNEPQSKANPAKDT